MVFFSYLVGEPLESSWRLRHRPLFGLHFTLSSGTLKHTFSEQLSVPFSGKLQHLRFTYVAAG